MLVNNAHLLLLTFTYHYLPLLTITYLYLPLYGRCPEPEPVHEPAALEPCPQFVELLEQLRRSLEPQRCECENFHVALD